MTIYKDVSLTVKVAYSFVLGMLTIYAVAFVAWAYLLVREQTQSKGSMGSVVETKKGQ